MARYDMLRVSLLGGYNKNDVHDYIQSLENEIESIKVMYQQEQNALQAELDRQAESCMTEEERQDQMSEHRAYYLGVPVTASAVLAPLFYLLSLHFSLNCAVVYALGLFLLGVLYITPIRVKKPQLRGVALLSIFGLGEFAVLLRVLTR